MRDSLEKTCSLHVRASIVGYIQRKFIFLRNVSGFKEKGVVTIFSLGCDAAKASVIRILTFLLEKDGKYRGACFYACPLQPEKLVKTRKKEQKSRFSR